MIIAIDGPAGAGKSTVARRIADVLGCTYLDTGAMYRAVTLTVLKRGIDPSAEEACGEVARSLELAFDAQGRILIDGVPGEPGIRSHEVTGAVSTVSAHPAVREAVVAVQRRLAERSGDSAAGGLVAEGRDTTTVVFPNATHKFFLIATASERAQRRARQLNQEDRRTEIQADIARRDRLDATRAVSPLRQAPEATVVDTEGLDAEGVVQQILAHVRDPGGARH